MKSLLVSLWLRCAQDIARMGSYPGTTRDVLTVTSRTEAEGLSFLTITLPTFCRDFERSLEEGRIASTSFRSFKKDGLIPLFLGGITKHVFDRTGLLLENADPKAIGHIRQLTLMFKKLKADCSPERQQAALRAFKQVECDMSNLRVDRRRLFRFRQLSRLLWHKFEVNPETLRPRFGPGVTADRLSHTARREFSYWPKRLDEYFPFYGTALSIGAYDGDNHLVDEDREIPVRVILVPKTLKAPRVIAAEPASMQFCQQSLLDHLMRKIGSHYPNFLSLDDQTRNQRLSYNLACATLDLSEASDRCHGALAWLMLESVPLLQGMAFACRSRQAELPDGTIVPLQKFASMGSALCFPIETMVFFTITLLGCLGNRPIQDARKLLAELDGKCSLFGDDIIIPKEYASDVIDELQAFGLKVNRDKSFVTGKFRESCGSDVYDGVDVTPLYCRHFLTPDVPEAVVSLVSLANRLYLRGYHNTAEAIRDTLGLKYLTRVPNERYLGYVFSGKEKYRFNKALQRREFVTHVGVPRTKTISNDGWSGLSDWFHRSLRAYDTSQMKERSKEIPLKIKRIWTAVE